MFTNLIESDSHRQEFKRRTSFFFATVTAYALILFLAGIASIYAYDARLESLSNDITLLSWVPPVTRTADRDRPQPIRRAPVSNNSRASSQPTRPILYESASNPRMPPDQISAVPNPIPPAPPNAIVRPYVSDPPIAPSSSNSCVTCSGEGNAPRVLETTPPPAPISIKPPTQRVTSIVLASKAINLPQPPYPPLAKQIHLEGSVPVQILVDEVGRVISAHAVSGNAFFTRPAEEAALRAHFTPTTLNGQPVKVQGVITYNFRLQLEPSTASCGASC